MYSTEYLAVLVLLLSKFLPTIGINIDQGVLAQTITTVITIGSGLWLFYKRWSRGGVTALGTRTNA